MKTKKRIASFSSDKISFILPAGWNELSEKQLRYVYTLHVLNHTAQEIAVLCFIRFLGINIYRKTEAGWGCGVRTGFWPWRRKFFLRTWEVQYFLKLLSFLEEPGAVVVNLSRIGKYQAVDKKFHGVPFSDYLKAENYYQGYLHTQKDTMLTQLATLLYKDEKGRQPRKMKLTPTERYSMIQWYYSLKNHFAAKFPEFFRQVDSSDPGSDKMPDMVAIMNSEIRALTGGDITKEAEILAMDTWRALTELNEKAREVREMEARRK